MVTATPTTLSFNYAVGDPTPAPQIVSITGAGATGLFSVDTTSTGWLQVSPTCPAIAPCATPNNGSFSLAVTVDPTGVNAGIPYFGTITVSGIGQATGMTNINVSLHRDRAAARDESDHQRGQLRHRAGGRRVR